MRAPWTAALLLGLALGLVGIDARADGVLLAPSKLEAPVRTKLAAGISRARKSHPDTFQKIRSLRGHRPETYRQFRSQEPSVMPELQSLGAGAGWALLDAIAFAPLQRGNATDAEWNAVREGLLLALGELRMPEASPVLRKVFASSNGDWVALRGAAVGLGKLGGDLERMALFEALKRGGLERDAALWGLKYVRRPDVVDAVSPLLGDSSEDTVRLAARTLGYVGSSWAWKAGNAGNAADEMPIRTKCAEVLLDVYLRYDGRVREQITRSLAMVAHPDMQGMISERMQRLGDDEDRRALEALKRRM